MSQEAVPAAPQRRRAKFGLIALGVLLILAGGAAFKWTHLNAAWTARQLRNATTPEDRVRHATALAQRGDAGCSQLVEVLKSDHPELCQAVVQAVGDELKQHPGDTRLCKPFLYAALSLSPSGQESLLELVPAFLQCPEQDFVARCREFVSKMLQAPTPSARVHAIQLAQRPELEMRADVVVAVKDSEPIVRRAALLAIGPVDQQGNPLVSDEDLFRCLHDSDWEVRALCEVILSSRGMSLDHIGYARKLCSPDPADRLSLLTDLREMRDPGAWLERLSQDEDPAVRAGAARTACECRLVFTAWMDRLMKQDPDGTVRRIVAYHRGRAVELQQAGYRE